MQGFQTGGCRNANIPPDAVFVLKHRAGRLKCGFAFLWVGFAISTLFCACSGGCSASAARQAAYNSRPESAAFCFYLQGPSCPTLPTNFIRSFFGVFPICGLRPVFEFGRCGAFCNGREQHRRRRVERGLLRGCGLKCGGGAPLGFVRGHIRSFSVFGAVFAIAALGHLMTDNLWEWGVLRVVLGFCYYSLLMVVESWLRNAAPPPRGRGCWLV